MGVSLVGSANNNGLARLAPLQFGAMFSRRLKQREDVFSHRHGRQIFNNYQNGFSESALSIYSVTGAYLSLYILFC